MRFKVVDFEQAKLAINNDEFIFSDGDYEEKYRSYLVDTATNKIIYRDGGEPEDQTLGRDQKVFVDILNTMWG